MRAGRCLWLIALLSVAVSGCAGTVPTPVESPARDEPQPAVVRLAEAPDLLAVLNEGQSAALPAAVRVVGSRSYQVVEHLEVANLGPGQTHKHNLWVALIQSHSPYQTVTAVRYHGPDYSLVSDEYGNRYLQFDFGEIAVGDPVVIEIAYAITLNELRYDLGMCEGPLPDFYTTPEFLIESANPEIVGLASQLPPSDATPCAQLRAYYDFVGDTLAYTPNNGDWGAMAALGPSGSDCTEYSSLLIALCRAAGIPARYVEGLLYQGADPAVSAQLAHAWAEVYLPGIGWMAVDPTLGRLPATRERYFARLPADHVIVTVGRHPSTLRGKSYFAHLYWGVEQTTIEVQHFRWQLEPLDASSR